MPHSTKRTDRLRRKPFTARVWLACLVAAISGLGHSAAVADEPLAEGGGWQQAAGPLIADARPVSNRLAQLIEHWPLPDEAARLDRQLIVTIAADFSPPDWLPAAAASLWQRFADLRRLRADRFFSEAVAMLDRLAARDAPPASATEAIRLLARVLRENPAHEQARAGLGYVRHRDTWVWPNAARRLDRNQSFSDSFGWLGPGQTPAAAVARAQAAADDPPPLARASRFQSDHWQIRSTADADATAALARRLEQTRSIWLQAFGGFAVEPGELQQRISGRRRNRPTASFAAVLLANRQQYIGELKRLEPRIAQTLGIYWTPTRTAWFFQGDEPPALTIEHEATHQLFAESRRTSRLAGERCGMWALEAVACYFESLEPTAFGFTLGGRTAGRMPAARERLLDDGFFIPLRELCAFGRTDLQGDPRLPQIYSQISGLADFFLNGQQGRFRDAFIEYLRLIYQAEARPDTLWRLCNCSPEAIDEDYRRHLTRP